MAEVYIGMERFIFSDVYKLFLKYESMSDNDRDWETLLKDVDILCEKYNNCELVRNLVLSLIEHIEFRLRKKEEYNSVNKIILDSLGYK